MNPEDVVLQALAQSKPINVYDLAQMVGTVAGTAQRLLEELQRANLASETPNHLWSATPAGIERVRQALVASMEPISKAELEKMVEIQREAIVADYDPGTLRYTEALPEDLPGLFAALHERRTGHAPGCACGEALVASVRPDTRGITASAAPDERRQPPLTTRRRRLQKLLDE